jgi:hypothetical protein
MSTTGNGASGPASFPSIYIGGNGNTQAIQDPPKGSYTTHPSDNLPRQVSAIASINTTATYNKSGGDYNATYDIWLAAAAPASTYTDAVSGEVMVWLYKPASRSPIGTQMATATVAGNSYTVWEGPRGSGSNPSAPVISYVLTTSRLSQTFDLKPILSDAAARGSIQTSWYVTDIFFGFEIWTGSNAAGLAVTTFTADVQ